IFPSTMRHIISVLLIVASASVFAQTPAKTLTDSLIAHSLDMVDYPPWVVKTPLPPMRPSFGVYMNNFPADSVKLLTHGRDTIPGNRIWQVSPHLSADEAGL